ncbi:hypothetical protein [Pedobacter sp. SL55]|uniref:hypothetical protein n=1 Tax=Pedobacter sp. SL55 TaxID=2995161 RepID=UPI00226E3921|nr:hypothetical protein [Pedobacter sp. SL55]WAC39818.1 hypothetical protein OVA16_14700 [Pedobacter sp. SL55]
MSDEELVHQIKSVFEDYNDGLEEQGWAELRKKYPEKENKKLPIWWLTGIAATLLVVVGLYFSNAFDTEKVILRAGTIPKENQLPESIKPNSADNISAIKLDTIKTNTYTLPKNSGNENDELEKVVNTAQQYIAQHNTIGDANATKEMNVVVSNSDGAQTKQPTVVDKNTAIVAVTKTDDKVTANAILNEEEQPTEKPLKPKLSTEEFLKEESKLLANSANKETKKSGASKTTFDVFTGTFFNYHDDNEAKLSAGVGLNANVKVTKNLVLSFGAGISQNKVSYDNKVPAEISQAMFASKSNTNDMNAPVAGLAYSATATNDLSFNGRLLSIDLPMVLKFFPSKKQDFYISTGINSSSYLSQKYTYNYSLSNFGYRNGEAQTQTQTEESNLKGFDFANSAIIAIGINQSIGNNVLIFEPYYKPALNTMGDKNLRISSAGLNLKFNFNRNNKK